MTTIFHFKLCPSGRINRHLRPPELASPGPATLGKAAKQESLSRLPISGWMKIFIFLF